jgi:hypothetical protein
LHPTLEKLKQRGRTLAGIEIPIVGLDIDVGKAIRIKIAPEDVNGFPWAEKFSRQIPPFYSHPYVIRPPTEKASDQS